eukprot:SAG31_NODE_3863_length_3810_cov_9.181083_2_plen_146_part_00
MVGAGCNAVLENLLFTTCPEGTTVLTPAPYYAAFEFDLGARAGLTVQGVVPPGLASGEKLSEAAAYYPTASALDSAAAEAERAGRPVAALLVSSPNNPLGFVYPPAVIAEMLQWCDANGIHYVSDEIYGGASADWTGTDGSSGAR